MLKLYRYVSFCARERIGATPNVPEERSSSPKAFQSVPGAICHAAKSPKSPFLARCVQVRVPDNR